MGESDGKARYQPTEDCEGAEEALYLPAELNWLYGRLFSGNFSTFVSRSIR
jgi:hypothetical protein